MLKEEIQNQETLVKEIKQLSKIKKINSLIQILIYPNNGIEIS
jgi:hypothetical protein